MRKKTFLLISGACAALSLQGASAVPAEVDRIIAEPPPRAVRVGRKPVHPLCVKGKVCVEVVVPEKSVPSVRYAGQVLAEKLSKAFGSSVPVVKTPSGTRTAIILGDTPEARKAGIDVKKLPRDGFRIKSAGKNILIAGQDEPKNDPARAIGWALFFERGTLNGVIGFLERFGGMRFYFPGELGEVIPAKKELVLPEIDVFDRPDKPRRRFLNAPAVWFPGSALKPGSGNAWCNLFYRMESFYVPNCHSLERLKFVERFGKDHPEYFAMDHNGRRMLDKGSPYYGNLCYTDPGFRDELFKDAVAFLKGLPPASRGLKGWDPSCLQKGFFNVMPKDHFRPCQCRRCREFVRKHSEADLVWDLAFDMADRIKKAKRPGYVTAMSYAHYTEVPKRPLPGNLLIMCAVQGPWADRNAPRRQALEERLKVWDKALGHRVWTWTYTGKYGGLNIPGIPTTTPRCVARYFHRTRDLSCGTFLEAECDHWIFSYMVISTLSRILWDSEQDPEALVDEHHKMMFGPAAAPMTAFFDRVEELWCGKIAGRIVETPLGPQAMPPSEYELWEKIYNGEQFDFFEKCFAEAKRLAANDKLVSRRVAYFYDNFLGVIKKARENYRLIRTNVGTWQTFAVPAEQPPVIDGREDDPVWKTAPVSFLIPWNPGRTGFRGGDTAEVRTTFKAAQDAKNLYFFVRCEEPDMAGIITDQKGPDNSNIWRDSDVEFFINASGDRKSYRHIMLSAAGEIYDSACKAIGSGNIADIKWNSGAEYKVLKNKDNWTIEVRFPLEKLGKVDPERFAFNMARHRAIRSKAATPYYIWSPYAKNFHNLENYGILRFGPPAADDDLVKNGDFTAPQRGRTFGAWVTGDDEIKRGIVALDKSQFRTGGQSLRIKSDGKKIYWVTQYMPQLKPDTDYEATWFIRCEGIRPNGKGYQGRGGGSLIFGAPRNDFFPHNHYQNDMPWTPQKYTFHSAPDTNKDAKHRAFLRVGVVNAFGTVWIDAMKLRELPRQKGNKQ